MCKNRFSGKACCRAHAHTRTQTHGCNARVRPRSRQMSYGAAMQRRREGRLLLLLILYATRVDISFGQQTSNAGAVSSDFGNHSYVLVESTDTTPVQLESTYSLPVNYTFGWPPAFTVVSGASLSVSTDVTSLTGIYSFQNGLYTATASSQYSNTESVSRAFNYASEG